MPYYNITLTDIPIQSEDAGTIDFSKSVYWQPKEEIIDMSDSRNNIQQYITKYKTTLESFETDGIEVRAANKEELDTTQQIYRNPGKVGKFWIATGGISFDRCVWTVYENGSYNDWFYNNSKVYGVRPIIEIEY